ncbi:MAG: histone [Candidatus Micrarchaeota archaeon]|nr:histone [Candidatus Micrarchaeota archaeon]
MDVPLAPVKRFMRKFGLRVSESAVKEFAEFLEEILFDISSEAISIAKLSKRKTVTGEDVRLARKRLGL